MVIIPRNLLVFSSFCRRDFFYDTKLGAPCARVLRQLLFGCNDRFAGDDLHRRHLVALTDRQLRWTNTIARQIFEMLLYDAVFQGMKGDDSHSATDLESFNSLIEDIFQHIELHG